MGPLYYAVGIYRWQGDREASDKWSRLIRRLKKAEFREVAAYLGKVLYLFLTEHTGIRSDIDFIVPVPGDPERTKERGGINIPSELGKSLSRDSSTPTIENVLAKTTTTPKRAGFTAIYDALSVTPTARALVQDAHILLLDDVTTHGHTFRACGRRLREAGVGFVSALALAHSEPSSVW